VAAGVVVIVLADLNAALILGLWVLRTIAQYVVAFFITLLLTPATRFLRRRGLSHGGATLLVFRVGAAVLTGLVYLFTSPLVTAAEHFGKEIPHLVKQAKEGRACWAAWCAASTCRNASRKARARSPPRSPRC
jgi:predicted PurR-regulated permease PerM